MRSSTASNLSRCTPGRIPLRRRSQVRIQAAACWRCRAGFNSFLDNLGSLKSWRGNVCTCTGIWRWWKDSHISASHSWCFWADNLSLVATVMALGGQIWRSANLPEGGKKKNSLQTCDLSCRLEEKWEEKTAAGQLHPEYQYQHHQHHPHYSNSSHLYCPHSAGPESQHVWSEYRSTTATWTNMASPWLKCLIGHSALSVLYGVW